jgi:transcriptional regulator GlxA family with amidase domain
MNRRTALGSVFLGAIGATLGVPARSASSFPNRGGPLTLPRSKRIRVAHAVSPGAVPIDFAGPWAVFDQVMVDSLGTTMDAQMPFDQYHVARSLDPIATSSGMRVVPSYTFDNAPQPDVIIVGAQPNSAELKSWIRNASQRAAVTASVCTGAFIFAETGLFDGLAATTHHAYYDDFAKLFPQVRLVRDVRYVENAKVSSAGGLTAGIDLALRITERYFGTAVAQATAAFLEYRRSTS